MKKQIIILLLLISSWNLTSYAQSNTWRLGYGETHGLSTASGLDGLNKLMQASQLPALSSDYLNTAQSNVYLKSNKWMLSYGSMSLRATSVQTLGGYKSSLTGDGHLLKVG
jgi:hypothetical protein